MIQASSRRVREALAGPGRRDGADSTRAFRDHFFGGSAGLPSTGFGTSPMTVLSGQTENAGHFAHPTASAMGQSIMAAPWT